MRKKTTSFFLMADEEFPFAKSQMMTKETTTNRPIIFEEYPKKNANIPAKPSPANAE